MMDDSQIPPRAIRRALKHKPAQFAAPASRIITLRQSRDNASARSSRVRAARRATRYARRAAR